MVLNQNKFKFAKQEIEFAGFRISENEINPLEEFLIAIHGFPAPTKLSGIRSCQSSCPLHPTDKLNGTIQTTFAPRQCSFGVTT